MKYFLFILLLMPVLTVAQKKEIVAYYPGYHEKYQINYVKDLEKIGSADKLTVLDYAFAVPLPDSSGNIVPKFLQPYSTYQEVFSSKKSIDGIADSITQPLRGQLNQLKKLKERHPNIKIMLSIGGWGGSTYFSDLALTPESREKFVDTCIDLFIKGNLPKENSAGGKGSAKGVFDGFDIDWEFPVSGGPEGTHYHPNDRDNLTALFSLFRKKLDDVNPNLLLTAAVSARVWEFWKYNFNEDQKYLDWFNVMTYDFHGSWDSLTGHHTNLLSSPEDPDWEKESMDHSVKYLMDSAGVNSNKIVPGAAFYGKDWGSVDSVNFGLYQPGKVDTNRHQVTFKNYHDFSGIIKNGYKPHWDDLAMSAWLYNPGDKIFWTYDDIRSIALKSRYVDAYNLRGLMFWEITGDDTMGTLVNTIFNRNMTDFVAFTSKAINSLPSIKVIEPDNSNNIIKGSNIIIKTKADDKDGRVVKVEFFVDGKSIGYNTLSPFDWVWFNASQGNHKIHAAATDNNGGKTFSKPVEIQVLSQK
jgi:chitinase